MGIDAQATTQALANLFSLQSERLQQLAFHIPIQPHELVEQTMTIVRRLLLLLSPNFEVFAPQCQRRHTQLFGIGQLLKEKQVVPRAPVQALSNL